MDEHIEAGGGQGLTTPLSSPRGGSKDVQAHTGCEKGEALGPLRPGANWVTPLYPACFL